MKAVSGAAIFSLFVVGISTNAFSAGQVLHTAHIGDARGPKIEDHWAYPNTCYLCHDSSGGNSHNGGIDYELCKLCHGADGAIDGVNDPEVGARYNKGTDISTDPDPNVQEWVSDIYDANGYLRPGKEKWCLTCHDDGHVELYGAVAPNIAGKTLTGTWQAPAASVPTSFQSTDSLIDGDIVTGTLADDSGDIIFDLGSEQDITHVRLFNDGPTKSRFELYGSKDLSSDWKRIYYGREVRGARPSWYVSGRGWNETRIDDFAPVRYLKLVRTSTNPLIERSLREFEYKADISYGYLTTGHKISCDYCHDTRSIHIDGIQRTYEAVLNNYSAGYRLSEIAVGEDVVPALEVPRVECNDVEGTKSSNDFILCFTCHDKGNLLGDAYGTGEFYKNPLQTNFRNDDTTDANGNIVNAHLRHLRGKGPCGNSKDWDSDWDGVADSPQSCTACHNVHGSPNPAMTRHGELVSTPGTSDKVPMMNFMYKDANGIVDPELMDVMSSTGGETQFYKTGPGDVATSSSCKMCHNVRVSYSREP